MRNHLPILSTYAASHLYRTYWLASTVLVVGITASFLLGQSDEDKLVLANRYINELTPSEQRDIIQRLERAEVMDVFPSVFSRLTFTTNSRTAGLRYSGQITDFTVDANGKIHAVGCAVGGQSDFAAFYGWSTGSETGQGQSTLVTLSPARGQADGLVTLTSIVMHNSSAVAYGRTTQEPLLVHLNVAGESTNETVGAQAVSGELSIGRSDIYLVDRFSRAFSYKEGGTWVTRRWQGGSDSTPASVPITSFCSPYTPFTGPDTPYGHLIDGDGAVIFWSSPGATEARVLGTQDPSRTRFEILSRDGRHRHTFETELAVVRAALAIGNRVFVFGERMRDATTISLMMALEKTGDTYTVAEGPREIALIGDGTLVGVWQTSPNTIAVKFRDINQTARAIEGDLSSKVWRSNDSLTNARRFKGEFESDGQRIRAGGNVVWRFEPELRSLNALIDSGDVTWKVNYRLNVITTLAGIFVIAIFGLSTFLKPISQLLPTSETRDDRRSEEFGSPDASVMDAMLLSATQQMQMTLRRSNLLLFSGIVVALVGLTLYYFALEQFDQQPTSGPLADSWRWQVWLFGRALGMLIFIEGLAIFFFRQYRSAIDDYKNFYNVRLRRENWSAAHDLLLDDANRLDPAARERLVAILLSVPHDPFGVSAGVEVPKHAATLSESGVAAAARLPGGVVQKLLGTVVKDDRAQTDGS